MRTHPIRRAMPWMLLTVSLWVIAVSTAVLVTATHANDTHPSCTSSTSAACATCDGTNKVYQCRPAALPTNCIYGTCPKVPGGPCGSGCAGQTCGTTDWNCADPPQSIPDSTACKQELPDVCCTANSC